MFKSAVQLYRAASSPPLNDGVFEFTGVATRELREALEAAAHLSLQYGRFISEPEYEQGNVDFSWGCGSNEHGRFYSDLHALLYGSTDLSRGIPPDNYYLVKENYLCGEQPVLPGVSKLLVFCEFISLLEKLSFVPDQQTSIHQPKSLIFVLPAADGQPPKTFQLTTQITSSLLSLQSPNLNILRDVASDSIKSSLNREEYRALFRLAIADILKRAPADEKRFSFLIENWNDVLNKYQYDIDCLINNFSFDKVRQEIAKVSLEYSAKFTSVLGDNTGKFLALPVPILAIAGILKAQSITESAILLISTLAVAIVFSGTIKNQFIQLGQLEQGFLNMFEKLLRPGATSNNLARSQIDAAQVAFKLQRRLLKQTLWLLRIGSWVPAICGTAIVAYRFNPEFHSWILLHLC